MSSCKLANRNIYIEFAIRVCLDIVISIWLCWFYSVLLRGDTRRYLYGLREVSFQCRFSPSGRRINDTRPMFVHVRPLPIIGADRCEAVNSASLLRKQQSGGISLRSATPAKQTSFLRIHVACWGAKNNMPQALHACFPSAKNCSFLLIR